MNPDQTAPKGAINMNPDQTASIRGKQYEP